MLERRAETPTPKTRVNTWGVTTKPLAIGSLPRGSCVTMGYMLITML